MIQTMTALVRNHKPRGILEKRMKDVRKKHLPRGILTQIMEYVTV